MLFVLSEELSLWFGVGLRLIGEEQLDSFPDELAAPVMALGFGRPPSTVRSRVCVRCRTAAIVVVQRSAFPR